MSKKALIGGLLPLISNPATLTVAAVGLVGWTLYNIFKDKEQEEPDQAETTVDTPIGDEPFHDPLNEQSNQPLDIWDDPEPEPFNQWEPTAEDSVTLTETHTVESNGASFEYETIRDEEARKKELIRQAMSELGKRSAAKRRK